MTDQELLNLHQRALMDAVSEVRHLLEARVRSTIETRLMSAVRPVDPPPPHPPSGEPYPVEPAIDVVTRKFHLTAFERHVLVMCAAMEIDGSFGYLCGSAQGDPTRAYPTFGLAFSTFPEVHWSAASPNRPLRRWQLIETGPGAGISSAPLRIPERMLHFLLGGDFIDAPLASILYPIHPPPIAELPASHAESARNLAQAISAGADRVHLTAPSREDSLEVAAAACASLGLQLYGIRPEAVSASANLDDLIRLCARECVLSSFALYADFEHKDPTQETALYRWVDQSPGLLLLSGTIERDRVYRPWTVHEVAALSLAERKQVWSVALGEDISQSLNGELESLAAQFDLRRPELRAGIESAVQTRHADDLKQRLWRVCRIHSQLALRELAERVEAKATLADLVLPAPMIQTIREMIHSQRHRMTVLHDWGFAAKSSRGLGMSSLFAGPSGTGKTMAAEVVANELRLDLFRIDLSGVVSKYIGETEKNLRRIFDAAEDGGNVLLFDEADALFGKRSEVRDSHDRYANIETSYLLQRMEAYRGLAILTTNLKGSMDKAFLRRLRHILHFPFPGSKEREEIWKRVFPADVPTEDLDAAKLARLHVAGGAIRSIAMNAAFLAAEDGMRVGMHHILRAAEAEYRKSESVPSPAEIGGWERADRSPNLQTQRP